MADGLNGATKPLKRGRRKGSPKVPGSGRKKGSPNKATLATREQILDLCDPVKILANVAMGKQFLVVDPKDSCNRIKSFPTADQIINAATILSHKLLPNLRAQELSGPGGGAIETRAADSGALEELMNKLNGMSQRRVFDDTPLIEKSFAEMAAGGDTVADSEGAN